jgi:hypothetical protein
MVPERGIVRRWRRFFQLQQAARITQVHLAVIGQDRSSRLIC